MKNLLLLVPAVALMCCQSAPDTDAEQSAEQLQVVAPSFSTEQQAGPYQSDQYSQAPVYSGANSSSGSEDVEYHNRNTGTSANYDLEVEYDGSGDVDRIIFPSGGYIGQHHITDQEHNGDGTITVSTDEGQEFTVNEEEGSNQQETDAESDE